MGFILDGLDTEAYDRNYGDRELLRRVLAYFKPHWKRMVLVAVAIAANSLAGTGGPILVARGIDMVARNQSTRAMLLVAGGVLLLGMAAWTFNFIQQWFSARVVGDVVLKIREDVFAATIRLRRPGRPATSDPPARSSGRIVDTQDRPRWSR